MMQLKYNEKWVIRGLVCLLVLTPFFAREATAESDDDFFHMSLDELADQSYHVVSASRKKQQRSELSIPVTVVTAEDIHYSGLTSIPDLLRFYLGVDVHQYDRNRYGTGVRGIHDSTSDRTLVLVNGRNATNPAFGGIEWETLPLLIEDIDRIEIVRGPGGAAWGANAYNGVINIITKKPQDVLGLWGSTTVTEFGDTYSHLRYGASHDQWTYRVSAGYLDQQTSDEAGAGKYTSFSPAVTAIPSVGFSTFKARDFAHNLFLDSEFIYQQSNQTQWSFGAAFSNINMGDYEMSGYFPRENINNTLTRLFTRIDHQFDEQTKGYIQWYGNYSTNHAPILTDRYAVYENDIEAQIDWSPDDIQTLTFGGNLRWWRITNDIKNPQAAVLVGEPISERWAGLFLMDRIKWSDRLTLEGQIRGDWYSGTHRDWSGRATALYDLDTAGNHVLRLSTAKSFRAPAVGFRKATLSRVPLGGPMFAINTALPLKDVDNEETWSIEAGYHAQLDDTLTFSTDIYYQRYKNLIGSITSGSVSRMANIDGAKGYGVECELAKRFGNSRISTWYAFNDLQTDQYGQAFRSSYPTRHKAGFTFRHKLDQDRVLNVNYVYNSGRETYLSTVQRSIATLNRLDVTLSSTMMEGKTELLIGVRDLLNKNYDPTLGSGPLTAHEVPGRTFFGRFQYHF